jgi:RNA polymerase sigma-70 factor (ECF subfamily)
MTDPSDRDLAAAFAARRDEHAFRALYRRHTPALYAFALRLSSGAVHDAEEIVQDVWIRATTRLAQFDGRSALRTWLCGIAVNCWRERQRASPARSFDALNESVAAAPAADDGAQLDLDRAIARLPAGYRAVLLLHDVEGYTHDEIAAMLGIDPGTSKSQLSRARKALRASLGGSIRMRPGT